MGAAARRWLWTVVIAFGTTGYAVAAVVVHPASGASMPPRKGERYVHRQMRPVQPVSAPDPVPPEIDQRRRDGRMSPDERRLLRQHIEDAARELYKR